MVLVVLPAELLKLLMLDGVVDVDGDDEVTLDVGMGAEDAVDDVTVVPVVAAAVVLAVAVVVATVPLDAVVVEVGGDGVAGLLLLLLLSFILLVLPDKADSGVVVPLAVCSVVSDILVSLQFCLYKNKIKMVMTQM